LNSRIDLVDGRGRRTLEPADFPLAVGGANADVPVPGLAGSVPAAWLALADGELFIQSQGPAEVLCNGAPVVASQWLHEGDVVRIGPTRIAVRREAAGLLLAVGRTSDEDTTDPPRIVTAPPSGSAARVEPVKFEPRRASALGKRRRPHRSRVLHATLIVLVAGLAWLVFTTAAVTVEIDPAPERLRFDGGWLDLPLAGRRLLRPGPHVLVAERSGYRTLTVPVEISRETHQVLRYSLEKLPGRLALDVSGLEGAAVMVDGQPAVPVSPEPLELDAGPHAVRVEAAGYLPFETEVEIEGGGTLQTLVVEARPSSSPVTFRSDPPGASLSIAGRASGRTPATIELSAGTHVFELTLAAHRAHRGTVHVRAGEPQALDVELGLAPALLRLASEPRGAAITVDGQYRGTTPADLELAPGSLHAVRLARAGHEPADREFLLGAGEVTTWSPELAPVEGEVAFVATPADAELVLDGVPRGAANQVLRLVATPHRVEVRREGYVSFETEVTPRPGFPQSVRVTLKTPAELKAEATPAVIRGPQGQELVLVDGGRMTMGAPRDEPGRRSNETEHEVELVRDFYIATTEVQNRHYREFVTGHLSGRAGPHNLEIDHHPVVRVTWEEAARYCNWLSAQQGLPQVYVESGGEVVAGDPVPTGYRLPTEAEWAWAARRPAGTVPLKFPWGAALPIPPGAGNFADTSAAGLLADTLAGYDDRYPATAPVDAFAPNPLGLYNLGGNVAEWVHDRYALEPGTPGVVARDPTGPLAGEMHVIRGSSWMAASVSELRLSFRDWGVEARPDLGFRIARYAE
jgi:formylglycine-generating enzyme required for sulfatase activity